MTTMLDSVVIDKCHLAWGGGIPMRSDPRNWAVALKTQLQSNKPEAVCLSEMIRHNQNQSMRSLEPLPVFADLTWGGNPPHRSFLYSLLVQSDQISADRPEVGSLLALEKLH